MHTAATSGRPVLIHFYSDHCVPCKVLDAKAFRDPALCRAMQESVIPVKINVDHHRDLADRFHITRWPTDLYLYPDGRELFRTVSPQDPLAYAKIIERQNHRTRDWLAERIAGQPPAASTTRPRLEMAATAVPVTNRSRLFEPPAAQARSENAASASNPYCVAEIAPAQASSLTAGPNASESPVHQASIHRPAAAPLTVTQASADSRAPMATASLSGIFSEDAAIDLDGYCPVTLMARYEWVLGNPQYAVKHRGRLYYCLNEQARDIFLAAPDRFAPVLSGYDIVHFLETGELLAGRREFGCKYGLSSDRERIFLFANTANQQRFHDQRLRYAMSLGRSDEEPASPPAAKVANPSFDNRPVR
jgi:protein disulfide-isomerase